MSKLTDEAAAVIAKSGSPASVIETQKQPSPHITGWLAPAARQ